MDLCSSLSFRLMCHILYEAGQLGISPLNTTPISTRPTPPPPGLHQTSAAGSLPHLTPSSTYWARLITGAQHQPWPPHLPPRWWNRSIWDHMMGNSWGGVFLLPQEQLKVQEQTKVRYKERSRNEGLEENTILLYAALSPWECTFIYTKVI